MEAKTTRPETDPARAWFHCAKLRVKRGQKHEALYYLHYALQARRCGG